MAYPKQGKKMHSASGKGKDALTQHTDVMERGDQILTKNWAGAGANVKTSTLPDWKGAKGKRGGMKY